MMEEKSSWWQEEAGETPLKSGTTRLQGAPGPQVSGEFLHGTFPYFFWHLSNKDIDWKMTYFSDKKISDKHR